MKYIDAEKLKEKIQPHYENAKERARYAAETGTSSDCIRWDEAKSTYEFILYLISSLQKKPPEVDLEKEFNNFLDNIEGVPRMWHSDEQIVWVKSIAKHFFEFGIRTRKEEVK